MTDTDSKLALETWYGVVCNKLEQHYGRPNWREHLPPLDELISTILSQATTDANRDRGFHALKERYPKWELLLEANVADIVDAIYSAGLANQKGPRIQNALRFIAVERGELSLDFLQEMPLDQARAWLMQIEGVGIKTASIVLLFSFGRPAFPVDTHVHRVTKRLGLIQESTSAERAHYLLEEMGSPETFYSMHLNLIRHGREICNARRPQCERCFLQQNCDYYQSLRV